MKILLVTDYFLPDLGYESGLAEAYIRQGHDVLFSASSSIPGEKSKLISRTSDSSIPHRLHCVLRIGSHQIIVPGVLADIVRFRPALVHMHSFFDLTSVMLAVLKPIFRYRLVYSCHASHLNTNTGSSRWRRIAYAAWRGVGGRLIRLFADEINAVGENEQTMASWALGMDKKEVRIVRLGTDLSLFSSGKHSRAYGRQKLGLPEHDKVLILVGTLAPRKQAELLVRATIALREHGRSVSALIVGGGEAEYVESLKRLIEMEEAYDFVTLIDRFESRETIANYYASADIGVWPAEISIATIEAMASGLPLVLKSGDPYRDFLVSGGNGVTFVAGDPDGLTGAISRLVDEEALRSKLGSNGREFARREFSWDSIATNIVARSTLSR